MSELGGSMTVEELAVAVAEALTPAGGTVRVLNDRCLVLDWRGLRGLILKSAQAQYRLIVSTLWNDRDEEKIADPDRIPAAVLDLFRSFWKRRGITFRQETAPQ